MTLFDRKKLIDQRKKFFFPNLLLLIYLHISCSAAAALVPEQLLPETTLAVCVLPNIHQTLEGVSHMPLFQAWSATRLFDILERAELQSMLGQTIAVALLNISYEHHAARQQFSFEPVVIADMTGHVRQVQEILETQIIPTIQRQEPTVEFLVESIAGVNIYRLENDQFQCYYTFVENTFILGLTRTTLEHVLTLHKNSRTSDRLATTLSHSRKYRHIVPHTGHEEYAVRVYVDIEGIWKKLRPYIQQKYAAAPSSISARLFTLLDQYPLQHLTWTLTFKEHGGYERMRFSFRIPSTGNDPPQQVSTPSPDVQNYWPPIENGLFRSERLVPATSLYYSAYRVNMALLWQQISTFLPSEQVSQLDAWLKHAEVVSGVHLIDDFLPFLGPELALICNHDERPSGSQYNPSALDTLPFLLLQVRNGQLLQEKLSKILTSSDHHVSTDTYWDTVILSFEMPEIIQPLTLYTAFFQDFWMISISPTAIRKTIAAAQQQSTLSTSETYRQLNAHCSLQGFSKGYINLSGILQHIRHISTQPPPLDPFWPQAEEYAAGMIWNTSHVEHAVLTESFSPVGGIVIGLITAWFVFSL